MYNVYITPNAYKNYILFPKHQTPFKVFVTAFFQTVLFSDNNMILAQVMENFYSFSPVFRLLCAIFTKTFVSVFFRRCVLFIVLFYFLFYLFFFVFMFLVLYRYL